MDEDFQVGQGLREKIPNQLGGPEMDYSNHGLNFFFMAGIFIVFAMSISSLIQAVKSNNPTLMVMSGAFIFALVVGTALFWSDGYIRTTMSEKFISLFTTSASVTTAFSPTASQPINIQVAIPEQAPPTVVVQTTPTPENSPSPAPETTVIPSAPAEEPAPPDRSEIFDLGSDIDGHFSDGVAYRNHVVAPGDTIYNIRTRNGLSEAELMSRNPDLDIRRPIIIGQEIKIPLPPR